MNFFTLVTKFREKQPEPLKKQRSVSTAPQKKNLSKTSVQPESQNPTNSVYKEPPKQLPLDFAEEMLFCELELEKEEIDLKILNKLLELYTLAIGHYESLQDNRYLFFKNRLQGLWVKTNVMDAMNKELEKKQETKKEKNSQMLQKQKEMEMNVEFMRKNKKVITKELVDISAKQKAINENLLNRGVADQENDIMKRLEARKNRAVSLPPQKLSALRSF